MSHQPSKSRRLSPIQQIKVACGCKHAFVDMQPVWDQHKTHYNIQGKPDKEPCRALFGDVVRQLLSWKQEDYGIVLVGAFNEDTHKGKVSDRLTKDDLNMSQQILKTTGFKIPPTHDRGSKPVCDVFATTGVGCKAAEVLK